MARYTGPVCKLCRREGEKLFLKGERCFTPKCAIEKRGYPPGLHGRRRQFRRRMSDYGLQLREKQKAKRIYGVMERQFRRYFKEALKVKGLTGATLLQTLERRLDNVVMRLGFAESRAQARQLVTHGHITVNGRRLNVPSYLVEIGDEIGIRPQSRKNQHFAGLAEVLDPGVVPDWLRLDPQQMTGQVLRFPSREQIQEPINEQLIVEFYSR
ncbi:MAG: 30S ribosomal protein S4 [Chloroflexi bacterium]|nr:MAG: 30S ribosomal protein S4 [Chloroflexota bacterium]